MKLTKYSDKPILSPNPKNAWESLVTTNPGAWYDEEKGEVIMVYRAAGDDFMHTISLGLAISKDGINFERVSDEPFFQVSQEGHFDGGSVEDPRIIKIGEWYFITYACVQFLPGRYWETHKRYLEKDLPDEAPWIMRTNNTRTALLITKDFKKIYRAGYLTNQTVDDRDVIIFPEKINNKFVILHRPAEWCGEGYPCKKPSIWISFSDDLLQDKKYELIAEPKYDWEYYKIGGSTPPIKTEHGWLFLYHSVDENAQYRVGAMLLDLENPAKVLHRTPVPIMDPEFSFEKEGIFKGICFPCGNVVIDGTLYVYYGGADQYVGLATCKLDDLVEHLLKCPE